MRCVVLIAGLAMLGCGKGKDPASASLAAKPPSDPLVAQRDNDEQAAYSFETAGASIEEALAGSKKLAPIAGGDAKEAMLDVADMLDSAGATLADHTDAPPPIAEYRKPDNELGADRQKAVTDALDALHELRDASGTLDDLSENVPKEHAQALDIIQSQTDDAVKSVEDGITRLGGKVPPEE